MTVIQRIEQYVSLPGDSETERTQKTLAFVLLLVSAVATFINAVRYFGQGLSGVGFTYLILAAASAAVFVLFAFVPGVSRAYAYFALVVLLISFLCNTAAHLLAGGYTSGLLIIQWLIISLILSVLLLRIQWVYGMIAVYVLLVLAAGLLEPQMRERVPGLDPRYIAADATSTMLLMGLLVVGASLYLFNQVERYRRQANDLLLNILPSPIAGRLKGGITTIADGHDDVTVLFADIVGFTTMSSGVDPVQVVAKLNEIFSDFDRLASKHGLEKIKTVGDAYMAAAGLPEPRAGHCEAVIAFAFDVLDTMARHTSWTGEPMRVRIGVNSGPVVAGVIGEQKFIYDLWGDAVNVASRMEMYGVADRIQVTQAVVDRLNGRYQFQERGQIDVKGKGPMTTFLLVR